MMDDNKQEEAKRTIEWERPKAGIFDTYSNQTHLSWSFDDVRLRFAQIGESDESLTPGAKFVPVNVEKAAITLSWRNAKILQLQLAQLIGNYEKVNGEIKLVVTLASSDGT